MGKKTTTIKIGLPSDKFSPALFLAGLIYEHAYASEDIKFETILSIDDSILDTCDTVIDSLTDTYNKYGLTVIEHFFKKLDKDLQSKILIQNAIEMKDLYQDIFYDFFTFYMKAILDVTSCVKLFKNVDLARDVMWEIFSNQMISFYKLKYNYWINKESFESSIQKNLKMPHTGVLTLESDCGSRKVRKLLLEHFQQEDYIKFLVFPSRDNKWITEPVTDEIKIMPEDRLKLKFDKISFSYEKDRIVTETRELAEEFGRLSYNDFIEKQNEILFNWILHKIAYGLLIVVTLYYFMFCYKL